MSDNRTVTARASRPGSPQSPVVALLVALASLLSGLTTARANGPLDTALDTLWSTPGTGDTRVVIVQRDGRVLASRYAPGFGPDTRLPSWSMAKTVTALALGLLVEEGKLALDAPAPVAAWRGAGDPRGAITLRQLLFMTSGLAHSEGTERDGRPVQAVDTVRMLFTDGAAASAAYAAARPLAHPPGTRWAYSTGTSQILADIVATAIAGESDPMRRRRTVADWFRDRLFAPLGLTSAEWDADATGTFLGGSLLHMTAPDYLRLGTFLLADGRAPDSRQVVPAAWLALLTSTTEGANNAHYGGHVWLNRQPAEGQSNILFHPRGGGRTFALVGHHGQFVIVDPETRLVIVRLGRTFAPDRRALRDALGVFVDAARAAQ
jgi:CubicO group peptidase (beta-lactamase class C family)